MGISIERELNELERSITTLRVDYERFFGGELNRPPVVARRTIEEQFRRYGNAEVDKAVERFRLQALQSRFNAFAELWEKRMQAREEGRTGPIRRMAPIAPAGAAATAAPAPKQATKKGPASAAEVAALLAAAEAAVARNAPAPTPPARPDAPGGTSVKPRSRVDFTPLFQRYVAARQALGEDVSKLKYEKFEEAVRRQAEEIRKRTGSSRLAFEIQTTDGKVRLVGRPAPGTKG